MSNATYNVVEPVASDWLETRDPDKDLLPSNPCCLFRYEDAYNKSTPSREKTLQCKCGYCGKIFLISRHDAQDIIKRKYANTFCSRFCANKSKIVKHKSYNCEFCGKFVSLENYYGKGRFCSLTCAKKFSGSKASPLSIKKLQKNKPLKKQHIRKIFSNSTKKLKTKIFTFSISTKIHNLNYNIIHIPLPENFETSIINGAKYIILQMLNKWSIWDINLLLKIKSNKDFRRYCRLLKIKDNPIFVDNRLINSIKICRNLLNKTLLNGSITIKEKDKIAKECERLLYEEKWSTKKVCLEYLKCNKFNASILASLGVRTYTVSEALLVRHNISPEQRTAYKEYRRKCKFNFTKELEDCLFDADKLAIHDDIPTKDHMVSVIYGFIHNIDPYLMSHPANCMILPNSRNSSKNSSCSITLNELIDRIEWFNETILAKTEDYAKKYRNKRKHMLGNIFSLNEIKHFKTIVASI